MSLLFHHHSEEEILRILEHTASNVEETFTSDGKKLPRRERKNARAKGLLLSDAQVQQLERIKSLLHDIRKLVHKEDVPVEELADFAEHAGLAIMDKNFPVAIRLCEQALERWTAKEKEREATLKKLANRLRRLRPRFSPT